MRLASFSAIGDSFVSYLARRVVRKMPELDKQMEASSANLETLREMTEHLAEAEEEARLFNKAVEQMHDAVILTKDNLIHYVNRAFSEMYGYSRDEIIGSPSIILFAGTPEEHEELGNRFRQVFRRPNGLARLEYQDKRKDGSAFWVSTTAGIITTQQGLYWVSTLRDITPRKEAEEQLRRQSAMLAGINKVLLGAVSHRDKEETARICLSVAEELTSSKFGFIGELSKEGLFDAIAISNPGWDACTMPGSDVVGLTKGMSLSGVDRTTLVDKKSRIVNDPLSHPDHTELPIGHPKITSFLGVPLRREGEVIGMIGLANKEAGYELHDQEAIETLSVAFVEALMFKER